MTLLLLAVLAVAPTTPIDDLMKANDEARLKAAREAKAEGSWSKPTIVAPTMPAEMLPAWARLHAKEQDAQLAALRAELSGRPAGEPAKLATSSSAIAALVMGGLALFLSIIAVLRSRKPSASAP
jgi:hypothetical protein